MFREAYPLIFFVVAALPCACNESDRGSGASKAAKNDGTGKGNSGSGIATKPKEKTKPEVAAKVNAKGGKKGTRYIIGDRTVEGKRFRAVQTFGPDIYRSGENITVAWPVIKGEYAQLKIGMRIQEEVRPILGFDELWYVPMTPTDRFILCLDDMEGRSMTLTFSGDWPNMKLVDKASKGLN